MASDVVTLDPDNMKRELERRARKAGREFRWLPVSDPFHPYQRILEKLQHGPLSEEDLVSQFSSRFSYPEDVTKKMVQRQEARDTILRYEEDGKVFYDITEKGRRTLIAIPGAKFISVP